MHQTDIRQKELSPVGHNERRPAYIGHMAGRPGDRGPSIDQTTFRRNRSDSVRSDRGTGSRRYRCSAGGRCEVDRYRCDGVLGRGGMGVVFLARDLRLDRPVAIKFITDASPRLRRRFLTEARAQARVCHESVCEVHETGLVGTSPYIAMRLVDGLPLDEAAEQMSLEEKVRVVRDVAEGLHGGHGIDVRPHGRNPGQSLGGHPQGSDTI